MTRHRSFAPSTGTFVVVPKENKKSEPFSNRKQVRIFLVWWARVDSNHRSWKQQIYSLSPLATREHAHIQFCSPWIACIYYHPDGSLSTSFAEFLDFCAESKNTKAKAAQKSTFLSGFLELVTGVEPATHWLQNSLITSLIVFECSILYRITVLFMLAHSPSYQCFFGQ